MEALEELAVSYERQDGEMEASNEEKAVLQCEIEKLQVGLQYMSLSCYISILDTILLHSNSPFRNFHSLFYIFILHSIFSFSILHFHSPFHSTSYRREHSSFWLFRK